MTVRTDPFGERYDDRFTCRLHVYFGDDGYASHMGWCGLDCPTERERVAREFLAAMKAAHVLPESSSPYFEAVREWAIAQEVTS